MDMPELTPWKAAMLIIVPFMARAPKLRAWLAVFTASVLAFYMPAIVAAQMGTTLIQATPGTYLAIDVLCGGLVLAKPAGIPQKAIGLVFANMALIDAGYLVSPQADHGILYYWIMLVLGWVQFAILAAWGAYDAGTYIAGRFGLAGRPVAYRADL